MLSKGPTARSSEGGVVAPCLCAVVLVGSWFSAGAAAGQVTAAERTEVLQIPAVALNAAVCDRSNYPDLTVLLRAIKPRVSETLAPAVTRRLALALPIAVEKVYGLPACRALFTSLGADGVLKLANLRYHPATWPEEARPCQRGNAALEVVGTPDVRLCKLFGQLDTDVAALILIHEALHTAGLSERPLDPDGLEAGEISLMVKKSCGP
jgi:hypothetical protein